MGGKKHGHKLLTVETGNRVVSKKAMSWVSSDALNVLKG